MSKKVFLQNGRLDIWLQSINDLKASTVNARLAAISHLIEWVGHHVPEHIIRPRKGKQIPKILSNSELKSVRTAAFNSENPLAHLIVTLLLETGIRVSELCGLNIHDVDFKDKSARVVGWAMKNSHGDKSVPAHRVVNREGLLTGKHHFIKEGMEELLVKEGIVIENNQIINFNKVFWNPINELEL